MSKRRTHCPNQFSGAFTEAIPFFKTPMRFVLGEAQGTVDLGHNKARSVGPGRLPAQPWCLPKGDRAQLRGRLIVRSGCLWLWGGAAGAGTWGQVSIGTFRWVRGT